MQRTLQQIFDQKMLQYTVWTILALLPVHAFVTTWFGSQFGYGLLWKSWKEILICVALGIAFYVAYRRGRLAELIRRPINIVALVYVGLTLIGVLYSSAGNAAIVAGLLMNLRFIAIFFIAQVAFDLLPESRFKTMWNSLQTASAWLLVGLALLALAQVFLLPKDFLVYFGYDRLSSIAPYHFIDDNTQLLRASATLRGPNPFGAFLLLPLCIVINALLQLKQKPLERKRLVLFLSASVLGLVALFLSQSRSAWLGCLAAVIVLVILSRRSIKAGLITTLLIAAMGFFVTWAATQNDQLRLLVFHSTPDDPRLIESSTDEHLRATSEGIQDIVKHPFGSGIGTAGPASSYNDKGEKISENYFVQIGQEIGVQGMLVFVALCGWIGWILLKARAVIGNVALFSALVGLTVIGLALHVWSDDPTALTWWALAGMQIAYIDGLSKKKAKTS